LIVALSRARCGLYILGRVSLFGRCYELREAFTRLCKNKTRLRLLPTELFESENIRKSADTSPRGTIEIVDTAHMSQFVREFYNNNIDLLKHRLGEEEHHDLEIQSTDKNQQVFFKLFMPYFFNVITPIKVPTNEQPQEDEQQSEKESALPKEHSEGAIVFEQVDFERLHETPKY
jgi:intron-binding protein aquarius